ncbi:hypothetical protein ACQ5SK_44295 [Bradyrhizobium japonicum]
MTRRGDLSSLAPRIAEMARMSITTQAMPRVRTLVPWFTQDY